MRLILTRHGETEENIKGIMQGHLHGTLSKKGIEQAKKLALRLKDEKIDCIYSSDLGRSFNTTKEIIKFHPNVPVDYVKELRERNLGEFTGMEKSKLGWDKNKSLVFADPKKGETRKQLYDRAEKFLFKVLKKHKNDTVLFVGHNGINKAIILVIRGMDPEEIRSIENFQNTSITILNIDEEKNHKIHIFNCGKHLNK
ncbi:MAG: histidine phosphatase family protein [Candidatus Woesearchaeota archaeon]